MDRYERGLIVADVTAPVISRAEQNAVRNVAAAVVTRIPIPRPKRGSWTTMFEMLFARGGHSIDYLICPPVAKDQQLPSVEYIEASDISVPVLRRYAPHSRFLRFFSRIKALTARHDRLVLLIIDDYNLLAGVHEWLVRTHMRDRVSIVFFIHGMSYFFEGAQAISFYRSMDEMVYLTHTSYALERSRTAEMPCEVSVLWNGVDKTRFTPVDRATKAALRASAGIGSESVCFLWLARDQPKKGLHIVLRAWEQFASRHDNVELAVIGVTSRGEMDRVKWFGPIPHRELAPYVQMADIYLFPTLWSEGFGLSVAEALSAGLLTVASDIGPMAEVLGRGRYGCLVSEPHVVANWETAIETEFARFVENGCRNPYEALEPERYSIDIWCRGITDIVDKWKARNGTVVA